MTLFDAWLAREDRPPVLHLTGELDLATVPLLTAVLASVEGEVDRVVVDCARLTFVDVTGVSSLLSAAGRFPEGMTLREPPPPLRRLVEILHLKERLPFES